MLLQSDETRAELLMREAKSDSEKRLELYRQMAAIHYKPVEAPAVEEK